MYETDPMEYVPTLSSSPPSGYDELLQEFKDDVLGEEGKTDVARDWIFG